uniref:Peptidase C1A papain C-terminal domain-containing protein n=1 Tax=Tetradesmus obliquus TaxID=3088 RepID=A0A383W3I5_TETOB|eukprot:jgi/Sobl393_1/1502/SZX72228.1
MSTENPQWVLPSACFNARKLLKGQDEADVTDWSQPCRAAAMTATKQCATISEQQPLYSCSFKSLNSFYQIEQEIRNKGAVVTRMVVNNDFEVQFNASVRGMGGLTLPPYRYNVTARSSFAHAALITGYNNKEYTWTILNSWGTSKQQGQLRAKGITEDGLFKIQMGLAGVGTPDKTYAVSCYPAEGAALNPNHDQPWTRNRRRLLTPQGDSNTCFTYMTQQGDTAASIVDHFGLDMRLQFVQDKANRGIVGTLATFKFPFGTTMTEDEVGIALRTANSVTFNYTGAEASMQCSYYDAAGEQASVTCIEANASACARPGENNITYLHFEVLNVPSSISAALRVLPTLDEELVAALRSFPALQQLQLYVGSGTLVPQLAALSSLEVIELHHYCLRGSVPARLVGGMPNLNSLTVTPVDHAAGGSDPAGGLCGISGTYPDLSHQRFTLY